MRTRLRRTPKNPHGSAIMLFGLMLPMFVAFAALSVDTGVLAVARAQLSTAADAAALAGAMQLADDYRLSSWNTTLSTEITNANTQAAKIGQANLVLGQAPVITQNPGNASGVGDIMVGYLNPSDPASILDSRVASAFKFNSVQVTAQRSADHVGLVPNFFGTLMGFNGTAVSVQSTATVANYSIKGFKGDGSSNVHLLPIVLDQTTYNKMIAGPTQAQDQYTWNPTTKTVTGGPDGVAESVLTGSPGNWGTVQVGVSNNDTSTLGAQIQYGITPAQMATFPNSTIQLDTSLTPPSITFDGKLGLDAGIKDNIQAIIGRPVAIPIYDDGNGTNLTPPYHVVKFAPVRILDSIFQGSSHYVIVQPALLKDPSAIPNLDPKTYQPWTSGGLVELHISR